jgi:type I restriction enzyme S subunit
VVELRRTILGLACRGALTSRRAGDGTGLDVLRGVKGARDAWASKAETGENSEAARHLKKIASQESPRSQLPVPATWSTATLLEACWQVVDCHNKTAPYTGNGVMLVRTSNVRDGKIELAGVKFISEETYRHWSRRCPPAPGDVLLTREAPMGEAGLVEEGMRLCMGQRIMLLRTFRDLIEPKYLLIAVREPAFQRRMVQAAVGSTVKHLRVGDVESLVIPIPPVAEQRRIVASVEHLMKLCDDLEAKLRHAEDTAERLVDALASELVA